jgi:hypothetical protein
MIGVFTNQRLGHQSFRGQTTRDHMRRCRGLHHTIATDAAGIARAAGDDHLEAGRHRVQPLRHVLADAVQATAAGADEAVWRDHLLDARQMRRQRAAIAGTELCRAPGRAVVRLILGMDGGDGGLQILQSQIELLRAELLGTAAEDGLAEGGNQLF